MIFSIAMIVFVNYRVANIVSIGSLVAENDLFKVAKTNVGSILVPT